MKTRYFLLWTLVLLFSTGLRAQFDIPNGDFEDWTSGSPDLWYTPNSILANPVTEVPGNGGGSAARGDVIFVTAINQNIPGVISYMGSGDATFAVDQNWAFLVFDYQFHPVNGDELLVAGTFMLSDMTEVGYAITTLSSDANTFTQLAVPITYTGNAALGNVQFTPYSMDSESASVGTYYIVDNVHLSNSTGTVVSENLLLGDPVAIYPNPCPGTTHVTMNLTSSSEVKVSVMNLLGELVWTENLGVLAAGEQSFIVGSDKLVTGMYVMQIRTAGALIQRQIQVVR